MVVEPVSGPTGSSSLCDESSRTLFELRARAWPGMSIGASTGVRSPIPPLATVRLRLLSTCQRHQRVLTLFDKTPRLPSFSNSAEKTCNHLTRLPQLGHPKDSKPPSGNQDLLGPSARRSPKTKRRTSPSLSTILKVGYLPVPNLPFWLTEMGRACLCKRQQAFPLVCRGFRGSRGVIRSHLCSC